MSINYSISFRQIWCKHLKFTRSHPTVYTLISQHSDEEGGLSEVSSWFLWGYKYSCTVQMLNWFMRMRVCVCVLVCMRVSMYMYVCVYMCVCVCVGTFMCMCVHVCIWVCEHVCAHVCEHVYVYVCVYMCACVSFMTVSDPWLMIPCVHVYVYVHVNVNVCTHGSGVYIQIYCW